VCIRYQKSDQLLKYSDVLGAWLGYDDESPLGDIYPDFAAPTVTPKWARAGRSHDREVGVMKFGLLRTWKTKDRVETKLLHNARSETVHTKDAFKEAFRKRRCIVPASAFFEQFEKRWVRFRASEETIFMAGIFEGSEAGMERFSVLTTEPNSLVAPVQDRMPALLSLSEVDAWLDPGARENNLLDLLRPSPDEWLIREDAGSNSRKRSDSADHLGGLFA